MAVKKLEHGLSRLAADTHGSVAPGLVAPGPDNHGSMAPGPEQLLKQIGRVLYGDLEGLREPGMRLIPADCLLRAMGDALRAEIRAADVSADIATAAVRLAELQACMRAATALDDGWRDVDRAVEVFGRPGACVEGTEGEGPDGEGLDAEGAGVEGMEGGTDA